MAANRPNNKLPEWGTFGGMPDYAGQKLANPFENNYFMPGVPITPGGEMWNDQMRDFLGGPMYNAPPESIPGAPPTFPEGMPSSPPSRFNPTAYAQNGLSGWTPEQIALGLKYFKGTR